MGVLDQQLRKLLASPGLPAVSPISLPVSAAATGEGPVCFTSLGFCMRKMLSRHPFLDVHVTRMLEAAETVSLRAVASVAA